MHLNELIGEVTLLMQAEAARNRAELEIELASGIPAVLADRIQLQQVVVNLIQNGIEAMSAIADRPRQLVIRSELQEPDQVVVAVRDSGVGIDSKNNKRIFDAFFTTKSRGMGMGLSICHSIIEAHGGRLWASNNNDYGATLRFALPVSRERGS